MLHSYEITMERNSLLKLLFLVVTMETSQHNLKAPHLKRIRNKRYQGKINRENSHKPKFICLETEVSFATSCVANILKGCFF